MLFVLCGFEHSIANMFFIPMGMILGAKITIVQLLFNLIVVTFGNIIGGAIIIPYIYHSCYVNKWEKILEILKTLIDISTFFKVSSMVLYIVILFLIHYYSICIIFNG